MCFLSPEVLARVRFLPINAYDMQACELRRYLAETIQLIDRQTDPKEQTRSAEPTAVFRPQFRHGQNRREKNV
ncbi:MAG: hypothetical protein HC895_27375 [Leptolyngbyaceae cyanobacterium SM1_3_5]|nr:hypothetical protein [Leptolyngbyaceae cyanobacterium SM1_3_5]